MSELFAAAQCNATCVTAGGYDEAVGVIADRTSRKKSILKKPPRLNTQQKIEKFFNKEVTDATGVEQEYIKSIQGRLDIHIDQLQVSQKVHLPVSEMQVK